MKILITLILTLTLCTNIQAANIAQSLCEYVQVDDKKRMRSFLKVNKLKIRRVFDGVECNGLNLVLYADSTNSVATGKLMISKLPKSAVSDLIVKLTNVELLKEAKERIK